MKCIYERTCSARSADRASADRGRPAGKVDDTLSRPGAPVAVAEVLLEAAPAAAWLVSEPEDGRLP
jgi:hypothetical protein